MGEPMKCLTVCQPWASAIVHGPKRIENRNWPTTYRGPLLIHAGKSKAFMHTNTLNDGTKVDRSALVFGAIIGIAELTDCERVENLDTDDPFAEGPWCWTLANVRAFAAPIPYRGQMGLFAVPVSAMPELARMLKVGQTTR